MTPDNTDTEKDIKYNKIPCHHQTLYLRSLEKVKVMGVIFFRFQYFVFNVIENQEEWVKMEMEFMKYFEYT